MSHDLIQTRYFGGAIDNLNIDSAGAEVFFDFYTGARVLKVGFLVTTAVDPDNAVDLTASIYRNPVAHSETNRVKIGSFKIMAANATNLAAGTVVYKDLHRDINGASLTGETAEDLTKRFTAPEAVFDTAATGTKLLNDIPIGSSLQIELDTNAEADSGAGICFVEIAEMGWSKFFWATTTNVKKDVSEDVSVTQPNP